MFTLNDELPDQYVITVMTILDALQYIKQVKLLDLIIFLRLKDHAYTLASPITAMFNSSLREGLLSQKANSPMSVEKIY